jgi:hypothetical protein
MGKKRKRNVVDSSVFRPKRDNAYCTVKTSLKSILRNDDQTEVIQHIVFRCNDIVTEAYQFIRLYCLHLFHNQQPLPTLDEKFIQYCIKAVGKRDTRGKKPADGDLQSKLDAFYTNHFKTVLDHDEKHDLCNLTYNIPYLATQMHTAIHNNLKEHFIKRLLRFINLTTTKYEMGLTKDEAKTERKKLKDALFVNDELLVPDRYKSWYATHRPCCLPSSWQVSLPYDTKANSSRYLVYSLYMNKCLEEQGCRLFQPLSLRTSIVPHYATFDTASLISFFAEKGEKGKMLQKVSEVQERFWNRLFNLDKRVFYKKRYRFNFMMQTDGVAVSLNFVHKEYTGKKTCPNCCTEEDDSYAYVDQLSDSDMEIMKGRNIVGCDPGKFSMVYMSDGTSKLRYNAFQRRTESMAKRNQRILLHEKKKNDIHQVEATLSEYNSNSVDMERFKDYLLQKNKINTKLRSFYHLDLHRKLKWRQFVYGQKSEDKFLDRMASTFGSDAVIAYGDWSRSSQMRHFVPTKGVGMRKLIAKRFCTVSVNEFRTSKLCCNCFGQLQHLCVKSDAKKKKVFRCLICPECERSESKQPTFVTRDLNSALNIRQLALKWMTEKTRPVAFCRETNATGLTRTSSEGETGQSVDFAARNGANLCESEQERSSVSELCSPPDLKSRRL